MATISAELLPDSAAVRLSVNTLSGIRSVARRDGNGINEVRTLPGVLGVAPATKQGRKQLATNPSCEVHAGGWVAWPGTAPGAATAGRDTTTAGRFGAAFFRVAWTAEAPKGTGGIIYDQTGLDASGGTYTMSMYVRPSIGQYIRPQCQLYAGTAPTRGLGVPRVWCPANEWTRIYMTVEFQPGENHIQFRGYATDAESVPWTVGATMDADGVLIEKTPTLGDYFDGATAATDVATYAWAGAAHESASVETVPEPIYITDYEPASGPLRYDLVSMDGALVSLDVAGFLLSTPWLFTPVIPGYSRRLERVDEVTAQQPSMSTVHDRLLGRFDPIVVMRPPGTRRGVLKLYAGTYDQARIILEPLRQATVMMLRQSEHVGLDMYFAATDSEIFHETPEGQATTWGVSMSYVELKRPEGPLAGALGWTYADLEAATARYADLRLTYATYADLRLNKGIE
jgi:hypothetical protein